MSRIIRFGILSAILIANLFFVFDSCTPSPSNPYQASNEKIYLTVRSSMLQNIVGSYTDSVGDSINIGVTMNLPEFIDSVGIKVCSQTGVIEGWTVFKNISASKSTDTLWYEMLFKTTGEKSIIAHAYIQQNSNYCDTIQINVFNMSAPVITANPAEQAVCLGAPDSFSVSAAGPGTLTYQWKNAAGNLTGAHYIGVMTSKLIIDTVLTSDTGSYACLVTNGMDSTVSSSSAKLTLYTDIVKFNCNGGSAVDSQNIICNTHATAPTTPKKTGYTFSGWYLDSTLATAFSFSMPITAPTMLYAKWALNTYTVIFNSNGGSHITDQAIAYDSTAILPTSAPTKAGYSFAGWYSDSTLAIAFSFSTPTTASITLYAKWALNTYTVSFNSNGGSAVKSQTIAYNSNATQPIPAPMKAGYSLGGWYTDSLLTNAFSFSTPITAAITLYAKWTINTYMVSFNSNGGSAVASQMIAFNSAATQPSPTPIKAGYGLLGWYSDSTLTSAYNFSTPITAAITLYAKWSTNSYTVNFNSNGGTAVSSQTIAYNSVATLPTPVPTKAGYTFNGWYLDSALTSAFNFSTQITASITLYAKWMINTYTVSFDSNGGSAVTNQTVAYNSIATQPTPAPTKAGYSFSGWYSDSTLTSAFSFSTPIAAAITLYAKWTINTYTVSFNSNGGSVVPNQTVAYNSTATLPTPAPTLAGNSFSGWYSDSTLTTVFSFSTPITAAITLYAKWTINTYTVSFNSNGGNAVANQAVANNSGATLPTPAPTKAGYAFSGWYSDSLLTNAFSFSTPIMASITLYAKWTINTYTVSFNSNGGSVVANQTIAYNSTATLPTPSPTKTGYGFSGWYSDSALKSAFGFLTPITAAITLYAKWTINTYTVSFNSNGGSAVPNQAVTYDSTATLPTPAPTKAEYSFAGWYSDSLLTSVFNFSTPITVPITLYAKWNINITFNSQGGSAVVTQSINYGSTVIMPNNPIKSNCNFAGWYIDSLWMSPFNFSTLITAPTTLYAMWETNDIDGNVYHTVTIGSQVWMVENLKTTKFNDGTVIPIDTNLSTWYTLTTPGYCWYNNDSATFKNPYGALYNWYAVNTGKLAPTGWHIPSDSEWAVLCNYLGGIGIAAWALKEAGTNHWASPNTGATNSSGFSALPGGLRASTGFEAIGIDGVWWSSSANSAGISYDWWMGTTFTSVNLENDPNTNGNSVRCVRDN